jgi:hypothetical protein
MNLRQRHLGVVAIVILGLALVLAPGFTTPAKADSEDVAMFYDDLSQFGQWVDYENYGPVWAPNNVSEEWRPYTDGRWAPTDDGYVFESKEPWGWATYHYGNWMPTSGYGWVWVPGRTWYPSTVDWRTSPETQQASNAYVGWAPIPPPNYVPPPAYAPAGYYQGMPVTETQTSPFWVFARAASFLLGVGQPYTPAYSYSGCGCLAPPAYVPTFFPQTVVVPTYVTPAYYPAGYFGGAMAAYAWGPPIPLVSRWGGYSPTVVNNYVSYNTTNITKIYNVRPPQHVMNKPYFKHVYPQQLAQGHRLPPSHPVQNLKLAQASLGRPNIVPPPKGVPQLQHQIPKVQPHPVGKGQGIPGAGLPGKATMKLNQQQQQAIKQVPANQQIRPVKPVPIKQAAQGGGFQQGGKAGGFQQGGKAGGFQQGVPGTAQQGAKPGTLQPGAKPGGFQQGGHTPQQGGKAGGFQQGGKPGGVQQGGKPGGFQQGVPGTVQQGGKPGAVKQGAKAAGPGQLQPGAKPGVQGLPQQGHPGAATGKAGQFGPAGPQGHQGTGTQTKPAPQGLKATPQQHQQQLHQGGPAVQQQVKPQPQMKQQQMQQMHKQPQMQMQQPKPQTMQKPQQMKPQVQPMPKQQSPMMKPQPQNRPQTMKPQPQMKPQAQPRPQMQPRPQPRPQAQPKPQPQKQQKQQKQQNQPNQH